MDTFPQGSASVLARCVSTEVRARIGADRSLNQQDLAKKIDRSQNYLSTRLRDAKPFDLDDVERLARAFDEDPSSFLTSCERHLDAVFAELDGVKTIKGKGERLVAAPDRRETRGRRG